MSQDFEQKTNGFIWQVWQFKSGIQENRSMILLSESIAGTKTTKWHPDGRNQLVVWLNMSSRREKTIGLKKPLRPVSNLMPVAALAKQITRL